MNSSKLSFVGVTEAAQQSGMSEAWWRQRILRREIPFHKIGRRVLIDVEDIRRLLENGRVEPESTRNEADRRHSD
jgi:excisionase family DNA binding protein